MINCSICGNYKVEANGLCASCNFEQRKAERQAQRCKIVVPIKKITEKRAKQNREYLEMRQHFLLQYPICSIKDCQSKATEVHHPRGRSNDNLTDPDNMMSICSDHHKYITENSAWAISEGYTKLRST